MDLVSRRTFVKGLAAGGAVTAFSGWPQAASAQPGQPRSQETLRGTAFDLAIGETLMNFTGSPKVALTINGSVPGPLLRWREGDTVTLRVRNELDEDTSIHWHGIILPANMDGVPGLSFHGIRPRETYHLHVQGETGGHLLVPQPLRLPGTTRRLRTARHRPRGRGSDRVRSRARHPALGLDRRIAGARIRAAQETIRLLQLQQAHARRLLQGCARTGPAAHARRSAGVGRDAHEPDGHCRRRRRHLHTPDERGDPERQLDRPFHTR